MKLLIILFLISTKVFGQVHFTGCVKDCNNLPVSGAIVEAIGNNIPHNNIFSSDGNGLFFIDFKQSALNNPFQLKIKYLNNKPIYITKIVYSSITPETYYMGFAISGNCGAKSQSISNTVRINSKSKIIQTSSKSKSPQTSSKSKLLEQIKHVTGNVVESHYDLNVTEGGIEGFNLHINFNVNYLQNLQGLLIVEFFDLNGKPLKDDDGSLNYEDQTVTFEEEFDATPLVHANFPDLSIFMPYDEFKSVNGGHHSKYRISILCKLKSESEWHTVCTSYNHDLDYTD